MKRSLRKLIPTFVMLVITAALLGTSTFAWFSMNNKVSVTGMEVKTRVSSNITIAPLASDAKEGNTDTAYINSLDQTRTGVLEPVSTINGINYYYTATSNVDAEGDAIEEEYTAYGEATSLANASAGKTNYDAAFQTNYGVETPITSSNVVYGYIDYVFYLKATNTDAAARNVYMDKCNLLYTGMTTTVKAWRVGMFVQTVDAETAAASAIASTDLKTILTIADATNQEPGKAVNSTSTTAALAYGAGGSTTTYNPAATVATSLASGTTQRYKITIRLWLEGEDTECTTDTFAALNADWRLDLGFTIGEGTGVTNIGSTAAAVATASNLVGTVTLSDTTTGTIANLETAKTFAWKNAADGSAAAGTNNAYTYTAAAEGDFYCLVTTVKGNVYRTNTVHLAPAP
ncbi:MAG: hypothetical protein J5697_04155 [Clostridia bacterium]|nr:hypothetical protein [Clostridia bacterium]